MKKKKKNNEHTMKHISFVVIFLLVLSLIAHSQNKMSRKEYINKYKYHAVVEMHNTGIPASITMAQGCLESQNGNSELSRRSNNHFGIKCKSTWKGGKVYYDDDAKNECFRKYKSVLDSYDDHSEFLMNNPRYSSLFSLKSTDYKGWAKGLKKAGYATDPKYATLLIKIIDAEELWRLDGIDAGDIPEDFLAQHAEKDKTQTEKFIDDAGEVLEEKSQQVLETIDGFVITAADQRDIQKYNRHKAFKVRKGDTFENLAIEFGMSMWEIPHYNDMDQDDEVIPGTMLYLERKSYSAPKGKEFHTVKSGETLTSISQKYGMKRSSLCRKNRIETDNDLKVGQKLHLRKRVPKE